MNNFRVATMKAAKNQLNSQNPKVHGLYCEIKAENYFNKVQNFRKDHCFLHHKLDFLPNKIIDLEKVPINQKQLLPSSSLSNLLNENSIRNCAQISHLNYLNENSENQKLSLETSQKKEYKQNIISNKQWVEGYHSTATDKKRIKQNQNCFIKSQGNKIILNPKINHSLFDHFPIKGLKANCQFRQCHGNQKKEENNVSFASTQETKENLENFAFNLTKQNVKEVSTHRESRHKKIQFSSPTFLRNKKNHLIQNKQVENNRYHHSSKSGQKKPKNGYEIEGYMGEENKNNDKRRFYSSQKNLNLSYSKNEMHFKPSLKGKGDQTKRVFQKGQQLCLKIFSHQSKIRRCYLRVINKIAQNGHNSIYLVIQNSTGFLYCLKKCEVKMGQQKNSYAQQFPQLIQYLIRQSKIGMALDHPFLIKTYCTLYDQRNIYQLMQFVEGESLHHHNEKRRKNKLGDTSYNHLHSIKEIKQIIAQLLEGIMFMHNKKIVHRDLKPANIFISNDHTFKIGDFGCSIYQLSNDFVGTLDYVSPEILRHHPHGLPVDMWAIGCIAYQLYTGCPPFFDLAREKTIQNIIECRYNFGKIEDFLLKNFIDKLLQVQPSKRMTAREAYDHPFISEHMK